MPQLRISTPLILIALASLAALPEYAHADADKCVDQRFDTLDEARAAATACGCAPDEAHAMGDRFMVGHDCDAAWSKTDYDLEITAETLRRMAADIVAFQANITNTISALGDRLKPFETLKKHHDL